MDLEDGETYSETSSDDVIFVSVKKPKKRKKSSKTHQGPSDSELRNILRHFPKSADAKTEPNNQAVQKTSINQVKRFDQKRKEENAAQLRKLINETGIDKASLLEKFNQRGQQQFRFAIEEVNEPTSSSPSIVESQGYLIIDSSPDAYSPDPDLGTDKDPDCYKMAPQHKLEPCTKNNNRKRGRKIPSAEKLQKIVKVKG